MIRIPPKAGIDERNAFLDIEERLRALESPKSGIKSESVIAETSDDPDLEVAGDLRVDNDVRIEGSIDAPHLYEGLIKVVPAETGGASAAQRTINMAASLAIAPGGLSADSLRCRDLDAFGSVTFERPACHLYRAAVQTITTATRTDILWTHEWFDNADMHDTTTNTDRITIPESGIYLAGYHVLFEAHGTGYREAIITLNDAAAAASAAMMVDMTINGSSFPASARLVASVPLILSAGDILRLDVAQTAGGDLDILDTTTVGPRANGFWCVKVSD